MSLLARPAFAFAVGAALLSAGGCVAREASTDSSRTDGQAIAYPTTRTVSVVDNYFGTPVADPYRWFEDASPESTQWAETQTAFAKPFLRSQPLASRIDRYLREYEQSFAALDSVEREDRRTEPVRLEPAEQGTHEVLVAQTSPSAPPRKIFDPTDYGALSRIVRYRMARDEQHVVVEIAQGGSDWKAAHVVRVSDGYVFPEQIDGLLFAQPVWTRDSKGFFYVRYQRATAGDRVMFRNAAVLFHTPGTALSADRLIFQTPSGNSEIVLDISLSTDGRYAILAEGTSADADDIGWVDSRLHVLDLANPTKPSLNASLLALSPSRDAAYRVIRTSGTTFTVLTDNGAPRHRLVGIDLDNPSRDRWRDIIPETTDVLQSVRMINNRLVAIYLHDVQPIIRVFTPDGQLIREIQPPPLSRVFIEPGTADSLLEVESESFLQPPAVVQHDLTSGTTTVLWKSSSTFPSADFVQTQRWFTSKDGTRVPIFLVHRKDIVLDGSHPALLYGYGASGSVMLPNYSPDILTWLTLGGVYAVPSLRGGGEFGRNWYTAAILDRKQTTFDDFIAAAEFLIAERYTSATRLGIQGESNGGQLVAAALTQRPDLFAAAIAGVPQTDNLRYDRGRHRGQFGTATDSAQFAFLFAYSPLHRIRPGVCYPATLVTTALNDDRSPAWSAMKFTAALQAAQSCPRPVLLRADRNGGHYGNPDLESLLGNATDKLTFLATQLGMRPR